MARQTINIGAYEFDFNADTIRDAFSKVNDNFTELYASDAEPTNVDMTSQTLGRTNSLGQWLPFIITDSIQSTLQDQIPATNVVGGLIEKVVYSKRLSRYTSGGELLLTLICNTGGNDFYTTKKFVFSRTATSAFIVTEMGTAGASEIYDSISIDERLDGNDLYLEVTVKAPDSGLPFIRVVGQITYTSVPIFLTASGY